MPHKTVYWYVYTTKIYRKDDKQKKKFTAHLNLGVRVRPLEEEALRLEIAVADVVLVVEVLDAAEDRRHHHLAREQTRGAAQRQQINR